MSRASTYRLGADVPDTEILRDRQGRVVDEAYVHGAVTEALTQPRGRGRPSPSQSGESPLLLVRISRDLDEAVCKAAHEAGASRSEWSARSPTTPPTVPADATAVAAGLLTRLLKEPPAPPDT